VFGRRNRRFEASPDEQREHQIEHVHALTYALLLDVVSWFEDHHEPVDTNLFPDYPPTFRGLPEPRRRLESYCSPRLLAAWEPVRSRWLERGIRVKADLGTIGTLVIEGLDGPEVPCAVGRFTDSSVIERGTQRQYNSRDWVLTVWLSQDLSRIEDATFRLATLEGSSSEARR
jgi:hypothetical protein